jgi:hypothetical protein
MRRFYEIDSGCIPVANETTTEPPPHRNDESAVAAKLLVN